VETFVEILDAIPDAHQLTEEEKSLLRECEEVIAKSERSYVEVGRALRDVRDQKLYRGLYGSFEQYVRSEWDRKYRWAKNLIDAYEVVKHLHNCAALPRNEAQARELAILPDERVAQVWQELLDKFGGNRMTAKEIERHLGGKDHFEDDEGDANYTGEAKKWIGAGSKHPGTGADAEDEGCLDEEEDGEARRPELDSIYVDMLCLIHASDNLWETLSRILDCRSNGLPVEDSDQEQLSELERGRPTWVNDLLITALRLHHVYKRLKEYTKQDHPESVNEKLEVAYEAYFNSPLDEIEAVRATASENLVPV
jgi:hypothetical protein